MERVIKRYLMHNQGEVDDLKQNEFDEIKQDMQLMRYEIKIDMKKSREDCIRNIFIVNNGIQFIAEELVEMINSNNYTNNYYKNNNNNNNKSGKFREFVLKNKSFLKSLTMLSNIDLNNDEKDADYVDYVNSSDQSSSTNVSEYNLMQTINYDEASESSQINKEKEENEEFNLERLAFDINSTYMDD